MQQMDDENVSLLGVDTDGTLVAVDQFRNLVIRWLIDLHDVCYSREYDGRQENPTKLLQIMDCDRSAPLACRKI